jgi:hypothetical protein
MLLEEGFEVGESATDRTDVRVEGVWGSAEAGEKKEE